MPEQNTKGVLYIVATPIGNLEDITYRAVRVLREAGLIACEDTRQTRKLLDHYGITASTISYHEHNEMQRARELVGKLEDGVNVAQVIREAIEDVVAVLGPERRVVIARELTKIHEEFIRGTAAEVLAQLQLRDIKGEITLLIGPGESQSQPSATKDVAARLQEIMREQNVDEKAALKVLAKEQGLSKSEVYRELQRAKTKR
jgi:16S rRNA C1402 (ribose-2'-O) methylase RsmI